MQSTPQSSDLALDEESMLMIMRMAGWDYLPGTTLAPIANLTDPEGSWFAIPRRLDEPQLVTAFKHFLQYK